MAALNTNEMDFACLAASVTLWSCVPYFSCHASIVYVPGGRFFNSNVPFFDVTSK